MSSSIEKSFLPVSAQGMVVRNTFWQRTGTPVSACCIARTNSSICQLLKKKLKCFAFLKRMLSFYSTPRPHAFPPAQVPELVKVVETHVISTISFCFGEAYNVLRIWIQLYLYIKLCKLFWIFVFVLNGGIYFAGNRIIFTYIISWRKWEIFR